MNKTHDHADVMPRLASSNCPMLHDGLDVRRAIAERIWASIGQDRLLLIAGGVTFFVLLALFPALGAFVSLYGLVLDPATIIGGLDAAYSDVLPCCEMKPHKILKDHADVASQIG